MGIKSTGKLKGDVAKMSNIEKARESILNNLTATNVPQEDVPSKIEIFNIDILKFL